jgi:UDP-N-acetylglucosamine 2-epimerase (non-hydrolysing)
MKILICYGTRPEYIKIKNFFNYSGNIDFKFLFVKQHENLVLGDYDYTLEITEQVNRLDSIFSSVMSDQISDILSNDFDYVLVQGDTATAVSIALSCYHRKINVIHLESGLRTYDKDNPYPEEIYRQIISKIADIHLCPTENNLNNLLSEKIEGEKFVVGNTVLDNLNGIETSYENKVLVTLHRRENHEIIKEWFKLIDKLAKENSELEFLLPIHPNPNVKKYSDILKNVKVVNPLPHDELINYLSKCKLCITDSGGLQEEGSFLNKKVIVCRKVTERTESIGTHSFICESPSNLENLFYKIKNDYIITSECPYGDGKSTEKIIKILENL